MSPSRLAVASTVILLLLSAGQHAAAQPAPDSLEQRVDALMAPYDSADSPGGVVAVIRKGEVVFAKGYGSANLAQGVPITPDTRLL